MSCLLRLLVTFLCFSSFTIFASEEQNLSALSHTGDPSSDLDAETRPVVSASTTEALRQMMREVGERATNDASRRPVLCAGKTGCVLDRKPEISDADRALARHRLYEILFLRGTVTFCPDLIP